MKFNNIFSNYQKDKYVYVVILFFFYELLRSIFFGHWIFIIHLFLIIGLFLNYDFCRKISIFYLIAQCLVYLGLFYPPMANSSSDVFMNSTNASLRLLTFVAIEFGIVILIYFLKEPFVKHNRKA